MKKNFVLWWLLSLSINASSNIIDFSSLANNSLGNGEVSGLEWVSEGLFLKATSLSLNVGCESLVNACLGADNDSVSDFSGVLVGTWVSPGSTTQSFVTNMGIEFCCEDMDRPSHLVDRTEVSLFDVNGDFVASFSDTDFFYSGGPNIGSFAIQFGTDAISKITFNVVSIPPAWSLIGFALLILTRRKCSLFRWLS